MHCFSQFSMELQRRTFFQYFEMCSIPIELFTLRRGKSCFLRIYSIKLYQIFHMYLRLLYESLGKMGTLYLKGYLPQEGKTDWRGKYTLFFTICS